MNFEYLQDISDYKKFLTRFRSDSLRELYLIPSVSEYCMLNGNVCDSLFKLDKSKRVHKKASVSQRVFKYTSNVFQFFKFLLFFVKVLIVFFIWYLRPNRDHRSHFKRIILSKRVTFTQGRISDDFFGATVVGEVYYFTFKFDVLFYRSLFDGSNALCFCSSRQKTALLSLISKRFFWSVVYFFSMRDGQFSRDFSFEIGNAVGEALRDRNDLDTIVLNVEGLAEEFGLFEGMGSRSERLVEGICRVRFNELLSNHYAVLWDEYAQNLSSIVFWHQSFYYRFTRSQAVKEAKLYASDIRLADGVEPTTCIEKVLILWPQRWRNQFVILGFIFSVGRGVPMRIAYHPFEVVPIWPIRLLLKIWCHDCDIVKGVARNVFFPVVLGYHSSVFERLSRQGCKLFCLVDRFIPTESGALVTLVREDDKRLFKIAVEQLSCKIGEL